MSGGGGGGSEGEILPFHTTIVLSVGGKYVKYRTFFVLFFACSSFFVVVLFLFMHEATAHRL